MSAKLVIKPFKGAFAVFAGEELLTRTHNKQEAEDYVRRLSESEEKV